MCQICQIEHNDSPLHVVVSTLANVTSKVVAKDVCLYDWLTNPNEEYQPVISAIRDETDNERIKALKKQLPVVIPSGFNHHSIKAIRAGRLFEPENDKLRIKFLDVIFKDM